MGDMKTCTKCGESKDLSNFSTSGKKKDGSTNYMAICKPCNSKRVVDYNKGVRLWVEPPEGKYKCSQCGETKEVDQFVSSSQSARGHTTICLGCHSNIQGKRYEENKEEINARQRRNKYKLTEEEYEDLTSSIVCDVCGRSEEEIGSRFHIDHCHTTGRVRGYICHYDNTALGLLRDSVERIDLLKAYVERVGDGDYTTANHRSFHADRYDDLMTDEHSKTKTAPSGDRGNRTGRGART